LNSLAATPEKRSPLSIEAIEAPTWEKRQEAAIIVAVLLAAIFVEIIATLLGAIAILGGAVLIVFTTPLTAALPLLILAVEALLNVVLGGVTVLLDTLLTTLALALSGALGGL
jgi:hypothetical protein